MNNKGKYDALEVAKQIIMRCNEKSIEVSNLKMQKLLYFVWREFYCQKRECLFFNHFEAWQFGPVVPDVYHVYREYSGMPIGIKYENIGIGKDDLEVLNSAIDKYAAKTPFELVNETHKINTPWNIIFDNGRGKKALISFELIICKECAV